MSKISCDEALALIRSFAALDKFPMIAEGQAFLAETLQECTVNSEHARDVCRQFDVFCPKPADIRNVAFGCIAKYRAELPACSKCQGTGYVSVTRRINGQELSAAAPCSCKGSDPQKPQPTKPPDPPKKPLNHVRSVASARKGGTLFD